MPEGARVGRGDERREGRIGLAYGELLRVVSQQVTVREEDTEHGA